MRNFFFSLFALIITPMLLNAQTLQDAVRYSVLEAGGTARSIGIGGGIGALGADFSVLSTNPAGLASYRRSEFTFTPSFVNIEDESRLAGENDPFTTNKVNFNFSNIGLVIASRPLSPNWTNTAFGFGINRLANFHQKTYYEGLSSGSITDRWVGLAEGIPSDDIYDTDGFEAGLAYEAEAIYNPIGGNDNTIYLSDFDPGEIVWKSQNIKRTGAYNEMVISYAGNYKDRFLIGATVGVPLLRFEETKTYVESDNEDTNPIFNELTYDERLATSGAGINLKLGMIFKVNQMFRIGAAIHTPTVIGLKDSFSSSLDYSYILDDGSTRSKSAVSPDGRFEYRIRTPWRGIGSVGFVFAKSGFLSAEVEYLDYTNAQFNFNKAADGDDQEYETELNTQIDDQLHSALNIRLGGEYALDKFRFRAGYAIMQSPYAEGFDPVGALSLGAGAWWSESFFMDIAYRHQNNADGQYSPYIYDGEPGQVVSQTTTRSQFMMTLGFKF